MYILMFIVLILANSIESALRDFAVCHDDYHLKPADGILQNHEFTWLAFLQYVHVTTGILHQSKAPRVVMVHRQFAVGTAKDVLNLPKNYKLGNVVLGDYERDEEECGLTRTQMRMGSTCAPAYMEMPILDTTAHPEYTRFGVGNSLAVVKLMRPIKSHYMLPICLPSYLERTKKRRNKAVYMIDYINSVPKDFDTEKMAKKTLKFYTQRDCRRYRSASRLGSESVTHVLCTSGCGMRSGAPIISHTSEGNFELIGIAVGGSPCAKKSMRNKLNVEAPIYVDVFPYSTWIVNVISAFLLPNAYPHTFHLMEGGPNIVLPKENYLRKRMKHKEGWRARTYTAGNACFQSQKRQKRHQLFYSERFVVNADPKAMLHVYLKISAGIQCTITCARLTLPNRYSQPTIEGLGGYNISVYFATDWFPYIFNFGLTLMGRNTTQADVKEWARERAPGFW